MTTEELIEKRDIAWRDLVFNTLNEFVDEFAETEGCQRGDPTYCGHHNGRRYTCESCQRWGGVEGVPKMKKRSNSSMEAQLNWLVTKLVTPPID